MRLYAKKKKNGERVWWNSYTEKGETVRRSTHCATRAAAEVVAARWERERTDPAHAAANEATLGGEAAEFLKDCRKAVAKRIEAGGVKEPGSMAEGTLEMYEQKIGHLVRILGEARPLHEIDSSVVKAYVDQRLEEGAKEPTVYKEWIALRGILKNARHFGRFTNDISALKPPRFSGASKPGERFLTWEQMHRLFRELDGQPTRRDVVRFVLATGARQKEWQAAVPGDVTPGFVFLHGTKTRKAKRTIPIPAVYASLIEGITLPLQRWPNAHRALTSACRRASVCDTHRLERARRPIEGCADCARVAVPRVTWNDLRRTFNSLLAHAGVPVNVRAELLGHESTRMAETTYTRTDPTTLQAMLERHLPSPKAPQEATAIVDPGATMSGSPVGDSAHAQHPSA